MVTGMLGRTIDADLSNEFYNLILIQTLVAWVILIIIKIVAVKRSYLACNIN